MGYKVLTLSPVSTSTKVAVFDADASGVNVLMNSNVRHDPTDLARFSEAADQLDYRIETILDELKLNDIDLADIDAFSGYCGGMGPTEGGIFAIDETVCEHVLNCGMNHPAILGAPILNSFATKYGKPAFAVNQPDTDELADVARITGYPGVYRKSHVHCLNQKEVAIRYATQIGKAYEEGNFIVAHIGGGLSVAAHDHGKMVDANDVLEGSGPFAPNRSGDVPLRPVVKMCFEGAGQKEGLGVIGRTGGLKGLVGTDDTLEIEGRIKEGDEWAKLCLDAMAYQTAKAIGAFAAVLKGKVDGICLTGGVSKSAYFCDYIKDRCDWIAPVVSFGGDFEMEALAAGAVRALDGIEPVRTYTGEPSWAGFDLAGAPADVEA